MQPEDILLGLVGKWRVGLKLSPGIFGVDE